MSDTQRPDNKWGHGTPVTEHFAIKFEPHRIPRQALDRVSEGFGELLDAAEDMRPTVNGLYPTKVQTALDYRSRMFWVFTPSPQPEDIWESR